jgi:C4-dicarboxylate transporter DctQ subunit
VGTIKYIFDIIEKIINAAIILLLMLMTAVIFYQVILRYAFRGTNIWAEEFARYAFSWVVLLGSASAVRRFQHIRIDFFVQKISAEKQKYINIFNYSLILIFLGVLIIYGLNIASRTGGQISAGLGIPISFMYMSIPVGSFLMLIFTLEILFKRYLFTDKGDLNARENTP